jgi:hypothetical protein
MILSPKISTLLIWGILFLCLFTPGWIEVLRFGEFRWIWKYGNLLTKVAVNLMLFWSLLLPILIWSKDKNNFKAKKVWVILVFIPFLYHLILLNLTIFKNNY